MPDPGSDPDGGLALVFDFPLNLDVRPLDSQPAIVTNLFYWNNIVHDVTYNYGFDEASGNFQVNNYGKGGLGNDDVRAEAQDGSGRNNANFGTDVDGLRPRMQMFEWRSSAPNPITVHPPSPIAGTYFGPMAGFGESLDDHRPDQRRSASTSDAAATRPFRQVSRSIRTSRTPRAGSRSSTAAAASSRRRSSKAQKRTARSW